MTLSILKSVILIAMAGVCALASTGLEPRTVGPAQSPGLLPVNCSTSDDYTSDLNVKGNVNSICVGYGPFVVAAHTISIQNINIVHGIIQYKIDNACDHDIQIDPDACKLEFNSIAYGCADDGRFYNGSAAYGCVLHTIQVFNDSIILPRTEQPRLFCEFAQPGNSSVQSTDLIPYIVSGCPNFDGVTIPASETYKWWKTEADGTVIIFKLKNTGTTDTAGDQLDCLSRLSFVLDQCTQPVTRDFYHGFYNLADMKAEIEVFPNGTDVFSARDTLNAMAHK